MKKLISINAVSAFFLCGVFLYSCNTAMVVSSWKAPDATMQPYSKILVIGLMGAKDREIRENVENKMVAAFAKQGITAGSAYAVYGPKAFVGLKEKATLEMIKNSGYDGAFIIALINTSKERNYVPGYITYAPGYYNTRFWGHWRSMYDRIYEPGYYTVATNYLLEADFYNLNSDVLEYSSQTKSFDPGSAQKLAADLSVKLVEDMMQKGVIRKQ